MKLQINKRQKIYLFFIINILLLYILYNLPIENTNISLCIYKIITGKECFNCGMTRAFLSILHFKFQDAIEYNRNVIIVFPLTIGIYLYTWAKYIFINNKK